MCCSLHFYRPFFSTWPIFETKFLLFIVIKLLHFMVCSLFFAFCHIHAVLHPLQIPYTICMPPLLNLHVVFRPKMTKPCGKRSLLNFKLWKAGGAFHGPVDMLANRPPPQVDWSIDTNFHSECLWSAMFLPVEYKKWQELMHGPIFHPIIHMATALTPLSGLAPPVFPVSSTYYKEILFPLSLHQLLVASMTPQWESAHSFLLPLNPQ